MHHICIHIQQFISELTHGQSEYVSDRVLGDLKDNIHVRELPSVKMQFMQVKKATLKFFLIKLNA